MSFRIKTILGIAFIEVVLLITLITMSIGYLERSNNEQLQYRVKSTANLFAKSVQDSVLTYDIATIDSLVNHLLSDPDIIYIKIFSNEQLLSSGGDEYYLTQDRNIDHSLSTVSERYT